MSTGFPQVISQGQTAMARSKAKTMICSWKKLSRYGRQKRSQSRNKNRGKVENWSKDLTIVHFAFNLGEYTLDSMEFV